MTPGADLQKNLRRYLLGQLDDPTAEATEKQFLVQEDVFDELMAAEDELIDDYLTEVLPPDDRKAFEKHFLSTSERQEQLKFGRIFKRYLAAESGMRDAVESDQGAGAVDRVPLTTRVADAGSLRGKSPGAFFSSPWRTVAFAVVLLAIALGTWRFYRSQPHVDKGLVALNAAYRQQRPLESRISNFDYAPYVVTRGPGDERVDQDELRRAELTLLDELNANATPAVHHALGKVYLAKKDFDKAIDAFNEALKDDPNNAQIYSDLGAAWLEKGKIDREGNEPGKGMEELGRSLENLNKALELNPNLLEALFNRALCRQGMLLPQQAADDWREYLKRDSSSMWAEEAKQQLRMTDERIRSGSENKEQLVGDFLAAYQTRNDQAAWAILGRSRERKGNLIAERLLDEYLNLETSGRKDDAKEKLQMVAYVGRLEAERAGDQFTSDVVSFYQGATPAERARSLEARGVAKSATEYYYKVEFERALTLYSRARELFGLAGNEPEELFAESWTGYCNLRIPRVKESLEIFSRLSQIYERKSYRSLQAQSLNALSDAELSLNDFSKALEYAQNSIKISEEIEDRVNVVRSEGQVVSVLLNLGSYRESLGSAFRGLTLAETSVYDPTLLWHFYHEASLAYYQSGMPSAAFDTESEAERLADIAGNSLLKARSLDRQALFYQQIGDYKKAISLLERALREADKISGESSRAVTQVHTALSLGDLYRDTGDLPQSINYYDLTLKLSERLNNLQIYLYRSHKGKLIALLGLHDDVAAEQELTTVISLFETYRDKIADETYRNRFFDLGQNTYDIAIDFEYSRRSNFEKAFDYAEASRARSLFDLMAKASRTPEGSDHPDHSMMETTPLLGPEVQERISDHVQILQYAVLKDKVLMWVVTREGLKPAESKITAAALDETVRRYRDLLLRSPADKSSELPTLARQLYENLITPVESRGYLKSDRQLCIVPDKSLNFLPFAALVSPETGRYLIESFAVQMAPSATIFVMSSQSAEKRSRRSTESLLSVGNPRFDRAAFSGLPDLPAAAREAQQVADLYNATPLIADRATLSRVRQELQRADVMHFATHAIVDEGSPLSSKLLFATEGSADTPAHHSSASFLEAAELYRMKLPRTRVVVLSACQTGIEKTYGGEGAISLARPFLAAGVPLVVATLWPVESEDTAELMISFHKHRKLEHLSTSEALRQAQLDAIRQPPGPRTSYNWAAFVPIGGYATY
jgi:CHAT domain-containing protein